MAFYSYITDVRNETIWSLYEQMRKTCQYGSVFDIACAMESVSVPIHYMSYRIARREYNRVFHDHLPRRTGMHTKNQQIYDSFINLCEGLRSPDMGEEQDRDVIAKALLSPAPCIGITSKHIYRILHQMGAK